MAADTRDIADILGGVGALLLLAGGVVTIPVLGIKLWELFGLWTGPVVLVSGLVLLLIGGMVNQPEVEY